MNEEVCNTGSRRSGIIMRMTSRSMSVDWIRTIPSKWAIRVAMVLLPEATVPPINTISGRLEFWNSDQTR